LSIAAKKSGRSALSNRPHDPQDIFVAMEAADIDAVSVNIQNMETMQNIFDIEGEGSSAMIKDITIAGNDLSGVNPPVRWTGFNVRENAMALIENATIVDNTNVRHIFSASRSASVGIRNAMISMTNGGRVVVSASVSPIGSFCHGLANVIPAG